MEVRKNKPLGAQIMSNEQKIRSEERVRVITSNDKEMIFRASAEFGHDIVKLFVEPYEMEADGEVETLNTITVDWALEAAEMGCYGKGDHFAYPLRDDNDLVATIRELFDGMGGDLKTIEAFTVEVPVYEYASEYDDEA
jgi:hypothetical protein